MIETSKLRSWPGRDKASTAILAGALAVALLAAFVLSMERESAGVPVFETERLAKSGFVGTPARDEREFKFGFAPIKNDGSLYLDDGMLALQDALFAALQNDLSKTGWKAPEIVGKPYFMRREPMTIVMRDLYFDSGDGVALRHAISYRLRHRFKSGKELHLHETNPLKRANFPYRGEIQAKVDRHELGDGFSSVKEARLEFRVESSPFSPNNPPPPAPWLPRNYVPIAQTGLFHGQTTAPAQALARYLLRKGVTHPVRWHVAKVLISTRMRMHLNLQTDYGSGPNPDQAFIISLDRVDVMDGREYMEFLARAWYEGNNIPRPTVYNTYFEIEVEFERNVSSKLDARAKRGGRKERDLLEAFLSDQKQIKKIVVNKLRDLSMRTFSGNRSKYQEAQAERK